jgi:hypothetical protein
MSKSALKNIVYLTNDEYKTLMNDGKVTLASGAAVTYSDNDVYIVPDEYDTTPKAGSTNPVTSGGIKTYVDAKKANVTNSQPTLAWGTTSKIGSVDGTDLKVTMPSNPNTDTHYTNTFTVRCNDDDDFDVISFRQDNDQMLYLKGSGGTTVECTADSGGNPGTITISSSTNADTVDNYHVGNKWGTVPFVRSNDGVMEGGKYIDFHTDSEGSRDYDGRLEGVQGGGNVTFPKKSGTMALTSDIPSVGDGKLTFKVNGKELFSWSANSSVDTTPDLTASWLGLGSAMTFAGSVPDTTIYDGSTDPTYTVTASDGSSTSYNASAGFVVIKGNKEFVWTGTQWEELGDESSHALKTVTINAGDCLTGGGNLESDRTISHKTISRTESTESKSPLTGNSLTVVGSIGVDDYGHIEAIDFYKITFPTAAVSAANAITATNVALSSTGTGTDTITVKAGTGSTQFTVNNVANATYASSAGTAASAETATNADQATSDANGNNISSTYLKLAGGTMTGALTTPDMLVSGGRVYGSGDDEGIVINYASNNYAGVCLGAYNGERSVFYMAKGSIPFWRYNNGSNSYDLKHPRKAGTIATTDDIPSSLQNPNAIKFKNSSGTDTSYNGSSAVDLTGGVYQSTYSSYWGTGSSAYSNSLGTEDTINTWVPVMVDGTMKHRVIPTEYNTAPGTYTFATTRGASRSTSGAGYWAAMVNSTENGSPTLPSSSAWWHVISMDWTGSDNTNWFSQFALPTQSGGVPHYRRNDASGTSIESSTWHAFITDENIGSQSVKYATSALQDNNGNKIDTTYVNFTSQQTISGQKTFSSYVICGGGSATTSSGLAYVSSTKPAAGQSLLTGNALIFSNPATANDQAWIRITGTGESDTALEIATGDDGSTDFNVHFKGYNTNNTAAVDIVMPKKSGTVALTSDLSGFCKATYDSSTGVLKLTVS